MGRITALHRKPKAGNRAFDGQRHSLEQFKQAWPGVPGDALAAVYDVIAFQRTDGNGDQFRNFKLLRKRLQIAVVTFVNFFRKFDEAPSC